MAKRNSLGKLATSVLQEFRGSLSSLEPTYTHIYVDSLASEEAILAVHTYFMPERTDATVRVSKLADGVCLFLEALVARERMLLFLILR